MWGNEAERASFRVENSGRRWSDGFLGPMRRSGDTLGMFVSGAAEIMKFRASGHWATYNTQIFALLIVD